MKNIVVVGFLVIIFSCTGKKTEEGDRFYDQGEYQKALEAYDKYLTIYPRNIKTLYNRARTYDKLGRTAEAKQDLTKLLDLEPNHLQARITLGELNFSAGNYEGAYYEFNKAVESNKESSLAYTYRAKANQKLGKIKKAASDYAVAIRLDPSNGTAYLYRGTLYIYRKKKSLACQDFNKAKNLGVKEADKAILKYCN